MAPPRIRPGLIPAVVPRYRRPALNPRIIDLMMRQSQELSEADRRQMAANVAPGQLLSAYFGGLGQQVREGFAHHQAQEDRRLALEDRQRLIAIQEEEAADRAHRRLLDDQATVYQRSKDQEEALQGAPRSIIESTLGPRYQVDPQEFESALREGRSPAGSVEAQDPTPRWTALQEGVAGAPLPDYAGLPLKAQASPSIPLETALPAQDTADPRTFMRASRGVDRETGKPLDPIAVPIVSDEQALERQKLIDAYTRRIEKADATDKARLEHELATDLEIQRQTNREALEDVRQSGAERRARISAGSRGRFSIHNIGGRPVTFNDQTGEATDSQGNPISPTSMSRSDQTELLESRVNTYLNNVGMDLDTGVTLDSLWASAQEAEYTREQFDDLVSNAILEMAGNLYPHYDALKRAERRTVLQEAGNYEPTQADLKAPPADRAATMREIIEKLSQGTLREAPVADAATIAGDAGPSFDQMTDSPEGFDRAVADVQTTYGLTTPEASDLVKEVKKVIQGEQEVLQQNLGNLPVLPPDLGFDRGKGWWERATSTGPGESVIEAILKGPERGGALRDFLANQEKQAAWSAWGADRKAYCQEHPEDPQCFRAGVYSPETGQMMESIPGSLPRVDPPEGF